MSDNKAALAATQEARISSGMTAAASGNAKANTRPEQGLNLPTRAVERAAEVIRGLCKATQPPQPTVRGTERPMYPQAEIAFRCGKRGVFVLKAITAANK